MIVYRDPMPGNPKDSPWRSTPRSKRKRKPLAITLSDDARLRLDALALKDALENEAPVSLSGTIERLIMEAKTTKRKK